MSKKIAIKVPDIGEFENIPVIEVLVKIGDTVKKEDSLVVLESDKATMEVPSPKAGKITKIILKPNDRVSAGDTILIVNSEEQEPEVNTGGENSLPKTLPKKNEKHSSDLHVDVLVLGLAFVWICFFFGGLSRLTP